MLAMKTLRFRPGGQPPVQMLFSVKQLLYAV